VNLHLLPPRAVRACSGWVVAYLLTSAVLVGLGFLLTKALVPAGLGELDARATHWFADRREPFWNHVSGAGSQIGNTVPVIVAAALITTILARQRHYALAAVPGTALTIELAVFLTANYIVRRPRPDVPIGPAPSTYSFPSGHSAAAVVVYAGTAVLAGRVLWPIAARIIAWIGAVLAPVGVGLSRVYEGMHFPSDVASGLLLGTLSLIAAFALVDASRAVWCVRAIREVTQLAAYSADGLGIRPPGGPDGTTRRRGGGRHHGDHAPTRVHGEPG
jgi:undecaprenyl-diphosphatase